MPKKWFYGVIGRLPSRQHFFVLLHSVSTRCLTLVNEVHVAFCDEVEKGEDICLNAPSTVEQVEKVDAMKGSLVCVLENPDRILRSNDFFFY